MTGFGHNAVLGIADQVSDRARGDVRFETQHVCGLCCAFVCHDAVTSRCASCVAWSGGGCHPEGPDQEVLPHRWL
jgi:hypothetical protein